MVSRAQLGAEGGLSQAEKAENSEILISGEMDF
jgi:hypothetical protein